MYNDYTHTGRHYGLDGTFTRFYYVEVPATQEEDDKAAVEAKQQRAAVQSKRHKAKTFHQPADKNVSPLIANFINKAK